MNKPPELFRWLVEASTDGLWILDESGATTYANARMAELLGRTPEAMVAFDVADALDETGRRQLRAHLAHLAASDVGQENVEYMFVRADGSAMWALVSFSLVRGEHGERLGWLHRVTPYTERKRLVEALRDREQQLATAQATAHVGSWEWEVAPDVVTWSDELYRIYNLEPQEYDATYEGFVEFVHPDDRQIVRAAVESTFAGADEFSFDARIVRKGGALRWIRGLGVVERGSDGTPVKMGGTTQDITDLKTADDHAVEATRRLKLLQRMTMAANEASSLEEAIRIAAGDPPDHTGWGAIGVYVVNDADDLVLLDTFEDSLADPDQALAERARTTGEVSAGPPNRHQETHSLIAIPVNAGGAVICVMEVLADEVPPDEDSYRLIEQIAAQMSLLAERERIAAQLAKARDAAMEASRLKSEFLATMSHEIRTPMNGVIGLNDLLLLTALDDHQRRLAEGLQLAGLTLLTLLNDILDLSKIEAGKLELEDADFDVRAVFEQTAAVLSGPAHDKGLELVVACHPDVPLFLRGDSVRFGQILTNLGSNAVKFTDRGEVVIQAHVVEQALDEVKLRVDVTDTGMGVAPEARARLFDAFTQADLSTTRRHAGTGLGLAISQQLVHALGGRIELVSELDHGSTFSFTVRLARASSTPNHRVASPRLTHGRRALVVDDNETNRFILIEQLAAWDLRPVAVASAEEALVTLREAARSGHAFDLALLDLVMPGVDGLELARRIGADPTLKQLTMILLSSDQAVGPRSAHEAGIKASLSKPVRHSQLYDVLMSVLGSGLDNEAPAVVGRSVPSLGITVLVVEDNAVNQLVATGMLENIGCAVDIAADGIEAVEKLSGDHGYAAVLMDCRMPRLDGFDATRAIRTQEPPGQHIAIIAMTASALEGGRERCLAAGMDDFLTKPVDPVELAKKIGRWTGPEVVAEVVAEPQPVETSAHAPQAGVVLDRARVRMLEELRKDGVSFFDRTAASFISQIDDRVRAIREAIDDHDANRAFASSHLVKGSALNLGLPLVGAAAAVLEMHAEAGLTTETEAMMDDLVREVGRAVTALREATAERS